jgi:hypothetical protein
LLPFGLQLVINKVYLFLVKKKKRFQLPRWACAVLVVTLHPNGGRGLQEQVKKIKA